MSESLSLDSRVRMRAFQLIESNEAIVGDQGILLSQKAVACAVILIATYAMGVKVSRERLSTLSGVTVARIRKTYRFLTGTAH